MSLLVVFVGNAICCERIFRIWERFAGNKFAQEDTSK